MINKNNIENYSIKELEKALSQITNNVTTETYEVRNLKEKMFQQLQKHTDIELDCNHSRYDTFSIKLKYFYLEFNIRAKSTGKIAQITKLRAKDIKCANGVKLKSMYAYIKTMTNKIKLDKSITNDYILKFDDKWQTSLNINCRHIVTDKNLKLNYILSDDYFNTNETLKEKIKKQLIIYGCQPIFMYSTFNRESILNPNPYKKLMKKFGYTYDDEGIKQFIYDRNKQLIDNYINLLIENLNK